MYNMAHMDVNITAALVTHFHYIPEKHHGQRELVTHFLSEVMFAPVN